MFQELMKAALFFYCVSKLFLHPWKTIMWFCTAFSAKSYILKFRLIFNPLAIGLIALQYSRNIPLQRPEIHHCEDLVDFTFISNFPSVKVMNLPSGTVFKTLPCQCVLGISNIQGFGVSCWKVMFLRQDTKRWWLVSFSINLLIMLQFID